ncbi:MAG: IS1634 family transposase [Prevotellaceae bacterium]|jgi:transposase|nr:IS1634 family transposase [Prevotellaceae bacterium]
MFVRLKFNRSGSTSVQIVQKIGRVNKVLKVVGCSFDESEIAQLKQRAHYEKERMYGATLFDPIEENKFQDIDNDCIQIAGPELIIGKLYDKIGFNQLKEPLLKQLVLSRLTSAGSKLQLSEHLSVTGKAKLSVYSIYRFLDKISSHYKGQIEQISFDYTKQVLGGCIGVVFYDMTTLYFESSQPDELRIPGFSKDGKTQHPQIFLGLLVGRNGYLIGYDIFEGHTLIPVIERFEKQFSIGHPIVVADSGLLTKDNMGALTTLGYQFILGAKIKSEKQWIIDIIEQQAWKEGTTYEIHKEDGSRLIIEYSTNRAKEDAFNRERALKKLEQQINSGKLTKGNINNRGYNKYLKMEGDVSISIDYQKIEKSIFWDGLKGYITNTKLSIKEIITQYKELWNIERAFRISKTDLQIRPIYHRKRSRIEVHICISFMAYLIYKELERLLKTNKIELSIEKAIEQINKMYEIKIPNQNGTFNIFRPKNNYWQEIICNLFR